MDTPQMPDSAPESLAARELLSLLMENYQFDLIEDMVILYLKTINKRKRAKIIYDAYLKPDNVSA